MSLGGCMDVSLPLPPVTEGSQDNVKCDRVRAINN